MKRLIDAETVEVDWYSGDWRGLKIEKEQDLRLNPNSTSNRNPYRIGDFVNNVSGERFKVTGIWDEDQVRMEKAGESSTYQSHVIYLSPYGKTVEKIKLRATRKDRAAVSRDTLAASLSPNLMISELSPSPVGMVLQSEPARMIKLGESLETMKPFIGDPVAKGTANKWGSPSRRCEKSTAMRVAGCSRCEGHWFLLTAR